MVQHNNDRENMSHSLSKEETRKKIVCPLLSHGVAPNRVLNATEDLIFFSIFYCGHG